MVQLGARCLACLLAGVVVCLLLAAGLTLALTPRTGSPVQRAGRYLFVAGLTCLALVGLLETL